MLRIVGSASAASLSALIPGVFFPIPFIFVSSRPSAAL